MDVKALEELLVIAPSELDMKHEIQGLKRLRKIDSISDTPVSDLDKAQSRLFSAVRSEVPLGLSYRPAKTDFAGPSLVSDLS